MARANARKTAISSVQGDRRSSSRSARPFPSRSFPTLRHHFGPICLNFRNRVDPADAQVRNRLGHGVENVSCGIGGGEVHAMSHCSQSNCDLSGNSRLSDSAFAHRHDDALAGVCDVRKQGTYIGRQLDIVALPASRDLPFVPVANRRNSETPINECSTRGTSERNRALNPAGIAARASRPRCSSATAI